MEKKNDVVIPPNKILGVFRKHPVDRLRLSAYLVSTTPSNPFKGFVKIL